MEAPKSKTALKKERKALKQQRWKDKKEKKKEKRNQEGTAAVVAAGAPLALPPTGSDRGSGSKRQRADDSTDAAVQPLASPDGVEGASSSGGAGEARGEGGDGGKRKKKKNKAMSKHAAGGHGDGSLGGSGGQGGDVGGGGGGGGNGGGGGVDSNALEMYVERTPRISGRNPKAWPSLLINSASETQSSLTCVLEGALLTIHHLCACPCRCVITLLLPPVLGL